MNSCSSSNASASVSVAMYSIASMWLRRSVKPRVAGLEKCEATRLRIDFAFPT